MSSDAPTTLPVPPGSGGGPVISARGLGKMYHLYDRPQDRLKQAFLWGRRQLYREFWALRNVAFDLQPAERLGIIGRNGSGKSTLLQILAGILAPTTGEVSVRGRVAALLELGSGFNPEFSGRENVHLNASVLGLSSDQIAARFDDIAAFADIGKFIDQPVKHYSSGMFVRLAFAVTTSVDADVLLIDEALAVGDVFFRQKCYRRLDALRDRGVAVILVSHAMPEIEQFCQRALFLHEGTPIFLGPASEATKRYYLLAQDDHVPGPAAHSPAAVQERRGGTISASDLNWPPTEAALDISGTPQVSNGWARCTAVALCDALGRACHVFQQGETASFLYEFELLHDIEVPIGGIVIRSDKDVIVHGKNSLQYGSAVPLRVSRGSRVRFRQDVTLELAVAEYTYEVGLMALSVHDYEHCGSYSYVEVDARCRRLCHLADVGHFAVALPEHMRPIRLLHHGVANLPGRCHVQLVDGAARDASCNDNPDRVEATIT